MQETNLPPATSLFLPAFLSSCLPQFLPGRLPSLTLVSREVFWRCYAHGAICIKTPYFKRGWAANVSYKVLYHVGESVSLKTKGATGRLSIEDDRLLIRGPPEISIPFESLRSVELLRMHGTGRMLKIEHATGRLFVSVIRFNLFGLFAVVNFFGTGRLEKELQVVIRSCVACTLPAGGMGLTRSQ